LIEERQENTEIILWLKKNFIPFTENYDLKKKSWIKCGGLVKLLIEPENFEDIQKILVYLKNNKIEFYPIGNLSNILFRDGEIKTPFISLKKNRNNFNDEIINNYLYLNVTAGVSIFKYVNFIQEKFNISGQEGLIGIPGTIGAAVITNASSYGSCISDYICQIQYIDKDCNIITLSKKEALFGWRYSVFQEKKNFLIYEIKFIFPLDKKSNLNVINERVHEVKKHREKFQEKKYPNLGSLYATKNLYYDLSKISFTLFFLYSINVFITKIFYLLRIANKLILFRKFLVKIYSVYFGIKTDQFALSDRTINCLVNKAKSNQSLQAFELIEKLEKKIKGKIKLENVLVKNIK
jgi:UDP-N-acetylmuramate dehydrogenase